MYYKPGDQVLIKNFARPSKLSPHYSGPYPVVRTSSHNVDLLVNDTVKRHHLQNVKLYSKKLLLGIAVLLCWLLTCASTTTDIIQPYKNSTGILFQKIGVGYQRIDEWSLVTSVILTNIRCKIDKLKEVYNTTKYISELHQEHVFQHEIPSIVSFLKRDYERAENALDELESSTVPSPPPRRRKRELFRWGSSF